MTSDGPSDRSGASTSAAQADDERVRAGQSDGDDFLDALAGLIAASPHNLVARAERPHVRERHLQEADALAQHLTPTGRWLDLGTGGGMPGLVLARRHRAVEWTLLDATRKKVDEVERFRRVVAVDNAAVVWGRAEDLAHDADWRGRFDGVVARAVAPLATLCELARGFLRDGGVLVAVKGPGWRDEVATAAGAMERLSLVHLHTRALAPAARPTWVVTMRADGPPPTGFPRASGIPKRDPLRARST